MFSRLYVEALLVDSVLAEQVWELWDAGIVTDAVVARARYENYMQIEIEPFPLVA